MRTRAYLIRLWVVALAFSAIAHGAPRRVTSPVPGLYQSIDPRRKPAGVDVDDDFGPTSASTTLSLPQGRLGQRAAQFNRTFDRRARELSLDCAFLNDFPNHWLPNRVPLVRGKGVPTVAWATWRQMKHFGIGFGQLKKVVVPTVANQRSYLRDPNDEEEIRQTNTYQYVDTIVTQSGHKIDRVNVSSGGTGYRMEFFLKPRPAPASSSARSAQASAKLRAPTLKNPYSAGHAPVGRAALLTIDTLAPKDKGDDSPPQPVSYKHLSHAQYGDIRNASLELMRKFDSKEYFYVGVGRSSSAIVTFVENLEKTAGKQVSYLPADRLRQRLSKSEFGAYFEKFIPANVRSGKDGRTILLFHRSDSGESLTQIEGLLGQYLQSIGSTAAVKVVGFSPQPLASGAEHIDTRAFPAVEELNTPAYFAAAHYPKHRIGNAELQDLKRNPEHRKFKLAMRQRMEADKQLGRALATAPFGVPIEGGD